MMFLRLWLRFKLFFASEFKLSAIKASEFIANSYSFIDWFTFYETNKTPDEIPQGGWRAQ
jgi:hypothetical protein